jgi:hypothetical protein
MFVPLSFLIFSAISFPLDFSFFKFIGIYGPGYGLFGPTFHVFGLFKSNVHFAVVAWQFFQISVGILLEDGIEFC